MTYRREPEIHVHRRRERDGLGVDGRRLHAAVGSGEFVRIVPGSYARRSEVDALEPIDRHLLMVTEAVDRARGSLLLCGAAAAAVWGIDRIGGWPAHVDTLVPRSGGGRSTGIFRRHTARSIDVPTAPWRGHSVMTPAQTAIDLAAHGSFTEGVVALDQCLWRGRPGGPLATADEVSALAAEVDPRRGGRRAREAAAFASARADSVRESQSRVLIHRLGFPEPVLQQRFDLDGGRVAIVDFWFPEHDHVGEFDGTGKYLDPRLRGDRSPAQVLLEEKDRGDALRRSVGRVSRWRTPDLVDPRRLHDILTADGLPAARPRPPRGLILP